MAQVAVSLGPSPRSDATFWRPAGGDRLVISRRLHGCAAAASLPLLLVAAALQRSALTDDPAWGLVLLGLVPGSIGALLLFARARFVLDSRQRTLVSEITLVARYKRNVESIENATAVRIDEVFTPARTDDDSPVTTFVVRLERHGEQTSDLATAGVWEEVVPLAEAVSAFLELPLYDYVVDTLRGPGELDTPLLLREDRRGTHAPEPPPGARTTIEINGTVARLEFPSPASGTIIVMAVFVGLVWTLPVFLSGSLVMAILPQVLLAWAFFHVRFGLRSSVEIDGSTLRVVRHGLFVERIHEFPSDRLEDLAVRDPEWGGSRNVIAHLTDGYVIARSDEGHARFGWGLSKKELEWLREYIVTALGPPGAGTMETSSAADDIPAFPPSWFAPLAGLAVGAVAARLFGGRLELCIAVPFLEHVLNTGGVIGLVCGAYVSKRPPRSLRTIVWLAVILAAAAVVHSGHPLLQPFPTYDEGLIAALKAPPVRFRVGWTVAATVPNALVGTLFLLGAGLVRARRVTNERRVVKRVPRRSDPERERRITMVSLFLAGLPFFIGGLAALYNGLFGRVTDRAQVLVVGLVAVIVGLALMQVWRLVPGRYWPTGVDWNAMIGVLLAGGAGSFIIAISVFGSDEGMNAPRPVVGAAGAIFLFAGIAILPQAVPRMAGAAEWIARVAVSLLLTCFAIVSLWAVLDGAYVFVLALLLTGGLALASWASLLREIARRRRRG